MTAPEPLIARNPATGAEIARFPPTDPDTVAGTVARARQAQREWAERPWSSRRQALARLHATLTADAAGWVAAIRDEIGKPLDEATAEVIASLDAIRWTLRHAGRTLADRRIGPGWQRWLLVRPMRLRWRPLGVVGMIGTWNYPLLLSAPTLVQALAAGNAMVWKPSELAAATGDRLARALAASGLPEGLVATVQGRAEVGQALISAEIDKLVFTGGVATGRRVLAELGSRGIPATAELSGFDAAIVLPDAPFESTVNALTWGAFVGAGQTCVAVKRVYVVGDPSPWAEALARAAGALRLGDPGSGDVDLGPMISPIARERFQTQVQAALDAGAHRVGPAADPESSTEGAFCRPLVLRCEADAAESALAGVFGPALIVRGFASPAEAVDAANRSPFGLGASVWGRNGRQARAVAERLNAGMIAINDAVAPSASAAAPFGGMGASGYGRTRGALGLLELVQPQTLSERGPGGLRPQQFPYTGRLAALLRPYRWLYHG